MKESFCHPHCTPLLFLSLQFFKSSIFLFDRWLLQCDWCRLVFPLNTIDIFGFFFIILYWNSLSFLQFVFLPHSCSPPSLSLSSLLLKIHKNAQAPTYTWEMLQKLCLLFISKQNTTGAGANCHSHFTRLPHCCYQDKEI